MATLKEVLHKFVTLVAGPDNELHGQIDTLPDETPAADESPAEATTEAPEDGEEAAPNA